MQQRNHLSRNLSLLFLNIRSLKNKLDDLKILASNNPTDVIILNETWLKSNEEIFYKIPGYNAFFNSRDEGTGGGCAIYVKEGISIKSIKKFTDYNSIIVELSFNTRNNINIITTYRPPREDCRQCLLFLENTLLVHPNSICMCDSNINLLQSANDNTIHLTDLLAAYGFTIYNNIDLLSATRKTSSTATIIDHAFSNSTMELQQLSLQDCSFSDHKILLLQLSSLLSSQQRQCPKNFQKTQQASV